MLDDLIDSLDDSSDIEPSAILRQIFVQSDNISNLKNNASVFEKTEFFGVTDYKNDNNVAIRRSTITRISEYQ